jgi:two-component system, cell cycle sensor histidine kinase and response regulator CckA
MERNWSIEALVESEARLRQLAEKDCDLRMEHDLDGRILEVNAATAASLERSIEELQTLNLRDVLRPEALEGFNRYLRRIERDGFAEGLMDVMTPAGQTRVWHYRNTLHRVDRDRPIAQARAQDVTAAEREKHILRDSEQHFRSIIENSSDMIVTVRKSGAVYYHSPATERLLGYSAEEIDGHHFEDFVHPDDLPAITEFLSTPTDDLRSLDVRLCHRDGSWRFFSVVASAMRAPDGRPTSVVVSGRDMTERRQLEAQLEQAKRLTSLGHLTATVAHEFNNVLMGMQPFADLMQRPGISQESVVKGARHIANSITRGKRVALDMLRFTRPSEPSRTPVRLREWWDRLSPELEAMLISGTDLTESFDESLNLLADGAQISQAFSNLVMNARDAMPAGGTIAIKARRPSPGETFPFGVVPLPESFAHFTVTDTGAGMPEAVLRHAFDPLFTTKQIGGTGLGLAVVHQVVAKHHGFVFVDSVVDVGTTFHLFLPLADEPPTCDARTVDLDPIVRSRRILIVDDEPLIGEGLAEGLRDRGMNATVVMNGGEAVAAAMTAKAEAAVIDIWLPDIDGIEVGLTLRSLDPKLKIVFVSGHGNASHALAQCAPATFLQKPFSIGDLLAAIAGLERDSEHLC